MYAEREVIQKKRTLKDQKLSKFNNMLVISLVKSITFKLFIFLGTLPVLVSF